MFLSISIIFFAKKNNFRRNIKVFFYLNFERRFWQNFFSLQIMIHKHRRENFLDQTGRKRKSQLPLRASVQR